MQPFSGYLPEHVAAIPFDQMSEEGRRRVIREYARLYHMPESDVAEFFAAIARNTRSKHAPQGLIPTLQNLRQKDMIHEAYQPAKRSGVVMGLIDAPMENLSGAGQVIPHLYDITQPHRRILAYPGQWGVSGIQKLHKAVTGKDEMGFVGDLSTQAVPMGMYIFGPRVISKVAPWAGDKAFGKAAWYAAAKRGAPKLLGHAAKSLTFAGSAGDVIGTLANTGYDAYENYTGKKAKRYTDKVRQYMGHNATPWQAASLYQGRRAVDVGMDTAKLVTQIMHAGNTGGGINMAGGSRVHTEFLTLPGFWDPFLEGAENKRINNAAAWDFGLEGRVARRKLRYRYRDGFLNGLGKKLAGEYFNYEHDDVDRQIAKERKDFDQMATYVTMAENPRLALRLMKAHSDSAKKSANRQRSAWMHSAGNFKSTAKKVGAEVGTLE